MRPPKEGKLPYLLVDKNLTRNLGLYKPGPSHGELLSSWTITFSKGGALSPKAPETADYGFSFTAVADDAGDGAEGGTEAGR